jgi:pyruvate, orthophosphate dikinase
VENALSGSADTGVAEESARQEGSVILRLEGTSPDPDREILGGKAWSIERMLALGIPVPPAFVIPTTMCSRYYESGRSIPDEVNAELPAAMRWLEEKTGKTFGGGELPLLVSVRSGAPKSMPGMMDTVLNLGMDDEVERILAERTGDADFAADTRRRFEEQYQSVVGSPPPADPNDQLLGAISAVFDSWQSDRANAYRKERGLPDEGGTAVTVQAMVFGNLDDDSGTGVLFTRDPLRGEADPLGEWLPRGQGEDVVSGRHDPLHLDELGEKYKHLHDELLEVADTLEKDSRDAMDIEFTVESGKLWLLQSRVAKRSPDAAVRLAVQLVSEGLISESEALDRVEPEQAAALLREHVDPVARADAELLAEGKPACPGLSRGKIVTDTDEAERRALDGEDVLLGRPTTDPNDVHAMAVVAGIVTEMGGATSHAAVVSRELGVPCVVGCGEGKIVALAERDVTMDAAAGEILDGSLDTRKVSEEDDQDLAQLLEWARADMKDHPAVEESMDVNELHLPKLLALRRGP